MKLPNQSASIVRKILPSAEGLRKVDSGVMPQVTVVRGCWVCGSAPPGVEPAMCCRDFIMADWRVWL